MSEQVPTAPAAHMVAYHPDPSGGGILVGHIGCDGPLIFAPNYPGEKFVRAVDTIQAVMSHVCPAKEGD